MYIATKMIESKFNKVFRKGDIVPDEIAEFYPRSVELSDKELLIDESAAVEAVILEEGSESSEVASKEAEIAEDLAELERDKKDLKKLKKGKGKK